MAKTLREKYIEALKALGFNQIKCHSRKYEVFAYGDGKHIYVGKSGGLRVGHTITGSIPCSDAYKAKLLASVL